MLAFIAPDFPPLLPAERAVGSLSPRVNEIIITAGAITPWTSLFCWGEEERLFKESKRSLTICLVCPFQDRWWYSTQQKHPRVGQRSDPEELCKKQMESKWPVLRDDRHITLLMWQPYSHPFSVLVLLWPRILVKIVGSGLGYMARQGLL